MAHVASSWVASLSAIAYWQYAILRVDAVDLCVTLAAHLIVLPMLGRRFDARLLPSFGCALCGMCVGFSFIDTCFDLLIVADKTIADGTGPDGKGTIAARHAAYIYYHTMLNASHINFALLVYVLVSSLGTMMGLSDSSREVKRLWLIMCAVAAAGNSFYVSYVVPRYVRIRAATRYEPSDFDEWDGVLYARFGLVVALLICIYLCTRLNLVQSAPATRSDDAGAAVNGKKRK
ncbi:hypothetical protein T492DRAFT_939026 [Pavlovales sp. CCMP2436]|nr:hypothetical protein T492DRAFT_939026 [Pavlovales sp. CCMP2436]|mmetsp:Transcript_14769/g.37263  ORF Transcript_14769/g.37263 Transcript_14769/m.37263 type:complete len:233 (-) Transcript_14769:56-754(-)